MGLNDIRLTPFAAAALYSHSLVETDKKDDTESYQPVNEIRNEPTWKFLGNNEKNILITVNYPGTTHLPDEELSFLTNILAACKLTLGDVAIINMNNYTTFSYRDAIRQFKSNAVLLFGIEPIQFGLPMDFPHYQVQAFSNCNFLFIPSLEERHGDELFKSKLWVSLRRIFGI